MYGLQCRRMTGKDVKTQSSESSKSSKPRRISTFLFCFVFVSGGCSKITNEDIKQSKQEKKRETVLCRKRERWTGYICRKEQETFTRAALQWIPASKRKHGKPKITWHKVVEGEMKVWKETRTPSTRKQKTGRNGNALLLHATWRKGK